MSANEITGTLNAPIAVSSCQSEFQKLSRTNNSFHFSKFIFSVNTCCLCLPYRFKTQFRQSRQPDCRHSSKTVTQSKRVQENERPNLVQSNVSSTQEIFTEWFKILNLDTLSNFIFLEKGMTSSNFDDIFWKCTVMAATGENGIKKLIYTHDNQSAALQSKNAVCANIKHSSYFH